MTHSLHSCTYIVDKLAEMEGTRTQLMPRFRLQYSIPTRDKIRIKEYSFWGLPKAGGGGGEKKNPL